jgi:ribosomal protein S12
MKIIYKNESGGVSVIYPTDEALSFMTIDEIAKKDVPTGVKYKIVEDSEVPTDRTFRNAWTVDESTLTDGVGE